MRPAAFLLAAWLACSVLAERPTLEHLHPTAVARSGASTIQLSGKFEPWPPKIWSSAPLTFTFPTNKGSVQIEVPAETPAGACLVRLYNDDGASEPAILVISETVPIADTEPNDFFGKAQAVTNLPAMITGRLDKRGDVDSFAIRVQAGQWLDARVDSYTLMSKVDAVLRLVRPDGYQLEWNHDFSNFDPRLIWRAPADAEVVLQIFGFVYPANNEIQLTGGNGAVYQLHLAVSDQPPSEVNPRLTEKDEKKTACELPVEILGAICPAGDQDQVRLKLKKDQVIEAAVEATPFGSPLDPWLRIEDAQGKELARNDDAEGSRDACLEWKAPADGEYTFVAGSLTQDGAEEWRYRFTAREVFPEYTATIEMSSVVLEPNSTNEVSVTVKRLRGFTNELTAAFVQLPDGVTGEKAAISGKEAKLKLFARDAAAFNGPVQIEITGGPSSERRTVPFELVSRSVNNGVPGGYTSLLVESTDQIWLTVKPAKQEKTDPQKAQKD